MQWRWKACLQVPMAIAHSSVLVLAAPYTLIVSFRIIPQNNRILTFNASFHDVVATDGTSVDDDVVSPGGYGGPLCDLKMGK